MSDSLKVGTITTYLSLVSNEELLPRDIYKNMKTRTQSVSLLLDKITVACEGWLLKDYFSFTG